ncbi:MAG: hypothetical protein GY830_01985 [Bacteroidetes bacterium]|nr:hypothetical protein [Bacteroidota bacterium]
MKSNIIFLVTLILTVNCNLKTSNKMKRQEVLNKQKYRKQIKINRDDLVNIDFLKSSKADYKKYFNNIKINKIIDLYNLGNSIGSILFCFDKKMESKNNKWDDIIIDSMLKLNNNIGYAIGFMNYILNENDNNLLQNCFVKNGDIFLISLCLEYLIYDISNKQNNFIFNIDQKKLVKEKLKQFKIKQKVEKYLKNIEVYSKLIKEMKRNIKEISIDNCKRGYWELGRKLSYSVNNNENLSNQNYILINQPNLESSLNQRSTPNQPQNTKFSYNELEELTNIIKQFAPLVNENLQYIPALINQNKVKKKKSANKKYSKNKTIKYDKYSQQKDINNGIIKKTMQENTILTRIVLISFFAFVLIMIQLYKLFF